MSQDNSIFAVVSNQTSQYLHSNKFFYSLKGARKYLKALADERRTKLGVIGWHQDEDSFSFTLGWEEVNVSFRIVELPIED